MSSAERTATLRGLCLVTEGGESWKLECTFVYMYLDFEMLCSGIFKKGSLRVLQAEDGKGRVMQLITGATKHVAAAALMACCVTQELNVICIKVLDITYSYSD